MKIISEESRAELNEMLHDEIVKDMRAGDTTVLFEIIEKMNNTAAFYNLSDEGQAKVKFKE